MRKNILNYIRFIIIRAKDVLSNTAGRSDIPKDVLLSIAAFMESDAVAFFKLEAIQKDFEKWQQEREQSQQQKSTP